MPLQPFTTPPVPFTVSIPQSSISDLQARLSSSHARWPPTDVVPDDQSAEEKAAAFGMGWGPTLGMMKQWAEEWAEYDWREKERELNEFDHFKVEIEGMGIHFVHQRSARSDAIPLILCHGWPGSFDEFLSLVTLLTAPASPSSPAFHVIIPSMPGFTFSSPPLTSRWTMDDTARVFDQLMQGLGYEIYAAQGGDWGSITARCLGALYPERCLAVHLNFCPAPSPSSSPLSLIPARTLIAWLPRFLLGDKERERAERALEYVEKGSGYYMVQQRTPRTLAYGLNDSPIGLLAWIGEKMYPFIASAKGPNPTMTKKTMFDTLSLYWYTNSIGTSFLPYALNPHFATYLTSPRYFLPRFGLSTFPREIAITPEAWVRKTGRLVWSKEADDGGHFAALEKPELLAQHLREAMEVMWPVKG